MEYKKVEHEIDKLLGSNGLNVFERKLLRKTKERFQKLGYDNKVTSEKLVECLKLIKKLNRIVLIYQIGIIIATIIIAKCLIPLI